MRAKEYLLQYQRAEQEINRLLEERARWEILAGKVDSAPGGGGRRGTAAARILDLEREIDAKVDRLIGFRREMEGVLSRLPNPREREVLLRRYVQGQGWEEVAEKMGITPRWTYQLHKNSLFSLERAL